MVAPILLSLSFLSGCGGPAPSVWAPENAVKKFRYSTGEPPEITLYTVISKRSGTGVHSGLVINGRERILFDPAGTFQLPFTPERNDIHFGMTDRALSIYVDYHARESYDVVEQRLSVSPSQAETIALLAQQYGAVPKAQCALSISRILSQVPGFETVGVGYFPRRLSAEIAEIPGVRTRVVSDNDDNANKRILVGASR